MWSQFRLNRSHALDARSSTVEVSLSLVESVTIYDWRVIFLHILIIIPRPARW